MEDRRAGLEAEIKNSDSKTVEPKPQIEYLDVNI